jgi:hypothetical protein
MDKEKSSMQKIKFTQLKQPLTCTIISDPTPPEIVRTMILSDFDGTDAYEINLMMIDKKYWNEKDMGGIFKSTAKPVLVCHYRWDYDKHLDMNEEERIQLLVNMVKWGASGIDLEADAFDPSPGPLEWTEEARQYTLNRKSKPRDWTTNAKAIERQKDVIKEVHTYGGEVLMSAHTRVHLPVETAVSFAKEMENHDEPWPPFEDRKAGLPHVRVHAGVLYAAYLPCRNLPAATSDQGPEGGLGQCGLERAQGS